MEAIERSEPEGTRVRHRLGIVGLPGFAPLPHLVLLHQKDLKITSEELNVFLHIFMHWHDAGRNAFPHTSTIAKRMDVSQRTVQRLVNQLHAKGLIEKIPGYKRKEPMRYDVRPLLKKLEGRAKSWAEERQIPIPQPPSISIIELL